MKKDQQNKLDKIKKDLTENIAALTTLKDDLESDYDAMSESAQESDKGEELSNEKEQLENALSSFEEGMEYLND